MLNWHRWAPDVMMSEDGSFRVYKTQIKDSQIFRYRLCQLADGAWLKRGEGKTFSECAALADDLEAGAS